MGMLDFDSCSKDDVATMLVRILSMKSRFFDRFVLVPITRIRSFVLNFNPLLASIMVVCMEELVVVLHLIITRAEKRRFVTRIDARIVLVGIRMLGSLDVSVLAYRMVDRLFVSTTD